MDLRDRPWFTEFGTNRLGTVDPETMDLREVVLPRKGARPRRLAVTSDDKVWYVDYAEGFLGCLDPPSGEIRGRAKGTSFTGQLARSMIEIPHAKTSPSGASWAGAARDRARNRTA
jgi:streptogramin lyase